MILDQSFVLLLNGVLEIGTNMTATLLLECTMKCLYTKGCSSYFYSKELRVCHLASVRYFSATGLTQSPEFKYYMMRPDCTQDWMVMYDHCYWYSTDTKQFQDAKKSCQDVGGYLAITNSVEEDAVFRSIVRENTHTFWIGGSDSGAEGQWMWGNGQRITLDLWLPSHVKGTTEYNCLEQIADGWMDGQCSYKLRYLCEK